MRHRVLLQAALLTAVVACLAPSALAQNGQASDTVAVVQAPVIVDGVTLFSLRGITAFPAERRAREIAANIRRIANDPSVDPSSVTIQDQPNNTEILVHGERLMRVFDEDAALESVDRRTLAEGIRGRQARTWFHYDPGIKDVQSNSP